MLSEVWPFCKQIGQHWMVVKTWPNLSGQFCTLPCSCIGIPTALSIFYRTPCPSQWAPGHCHLSLLPPLSDQLQCVQEAASWVKTYMGGNLSLLSWSAQEPHGPSAHNMYIPLVSKIRLSCMSLKQSDITDALRPCFSTGSSLISYPRVLSAKHSLQCQGSVHGTWLLGSYREPLKERKLAWTHLCMGTRDGFLLPEE